MQHRAKRMHRGESGLLEFFSKLFANDFYPPKMCFREDSAVLWLNVISDSLIALAYYLIPFLLFYYTRKRRDIGFHWIFVAFGTFILACGTTHLLGAVTEIGRARVGKECRARWAPY